MLGHYIIFLLMSEARESVLHMHVTYRERVIHCSRETWWLVFGFRRISLCHPWPLAARWWTPGWVWLSDRASPSPQSVHSFPAGPSCIQAESLKSLWLQRHPSPGQIWDNYPIYVRVSIQTWVARETRASTLTPFLWLIYCLIWNLGFI